ncbi:MT-A70 family methyltransferase [Pararhodospirillum photometricum]|uniref:MT-A70 family methyltransferase n=1 Tax=Pararhodospirillum photometricum TaxID=1084 RepID=UPI0012FEE31F|nr:MT-A70 family methyltransferase [Pararhodospirillum photometricum]
MPHHLEPPSVPRLRAAVVRHTRCRSRRWPRSGPGSRRPGNAVVYLWTTEPHAELADACLVAWGLARKSARVWVKEGRLGPGYWARGQHERLVEAVQDPELLVIGARGIKVCPPPGARPGSLIRGPVREHSRKPDQAILDILKAHPGKGIFEAFARTPVPGVVGWGDEYGRFPTLDVAQ